jgi:ATP-dependent RNA helicase RhlE
VILVPTRELVVQVVEEVEKLTKYMSVRTVGIFGGVYQYPKDYCLSRLRHISRTPGRIMDLTLDNVIRFEEMQNWLSMSLTKC